MNFKDSFTLELVSLAICGKPVEQQIKDYQGILERTKEKVHKEVYVKLCEMLDTLPTTADMFAKKWVLLTWDSYVNFIWTYHVRISNRVEIESSFFTVLEIEPFLEERGYYKRDYDQEETEKERLIRLFNE